MRKNRTFEFLVDYRKIFLEPLLAKIQLNRLQLQNRQAVVGWDYNQFKNHPYYNLDKSLASVLDQFFTKLDEVMTQTSQARNIYRENCKRIVDERLTKPLVHTYPSFNSEIGRAAEWIESLLSRYEQPFLYIRSSDSTEYQSIAEVRKNARNDIKKKMSELESEIKQPVTKSLSPGYDADLIYDFLFLNQEYDIKLLLNLRSELATIVAKVYEELWTRFVKSTGYSSTI